MWLRAGIDDHVENTGAAPLATYDQGRDQEATGSTCAPGLPASTLAWRSGCAAGHGRVQAAANATPFDGDGQPAVERRLALHAASRLFWTSWWVSPPR